MAHPSQCPISKIISFLSSAIEIMFSIFRAAMQGTFFLQEIRLSSSSIKLKKKFVELKSSKESASFGHTASQAPHSTHAEKLMLGSGLLATTIASVGQMSSHLLHSLSFESERTQRLAFSCII